MDIDTLFDLRDAFSDKYAALIAETLDSLPKDATGADADQLLYMLADQSNPFGISWERHTKRWRVPTAAEIISGKPL